MVNPTLNEVWSNTPPEWLKVGTKVAVCNSVNEWDLGTIEDINELYIGISKLQEWGDNQSYAQIKHIEARQGKIRPEEKGRVELEEGSEESFISSGEENETPAEEIKKRNQHILTNTETLDQMQQKLASHWNNQGIPLAQSWGFARKRMAPEEGDEKKTPEQLFVAKIWESNYNQKKRKRGNRSTQDQQSRDFKRWKRMQNENMMNYQDLAKLRAEAGCAYMNYSKSTRKRFKQERKEAKTSDEQCEVYAQYGKCMAGEECKRSKSHQQHKIRKPVQEINSNRKTEIEQLQKTGKEMKELAQTTLKRVLRKLKTSAHHRRKNSSRPKNQNSTVVHEIEREQSNTIAKSNENPQARIHRQIHEDGSHH